MTLNYITLYVYNMKCNVVVNMRLFTHSFLGSEYNFVRFSICVSLICVYYIPNVVPNACRLYLINCNSSFLVLCKCSVCQLIMVFL